MEKIICGIQQVGIGVSDLYDAWGWYKKFIGTDIRIFEDNAVAELMLPYTGGQPRERHAALALNMQGGGGIEIWQYRNRIPLAPAFEPKLGDLGIFSIKVKAISVAAAYSYFVQNGVKPITNVSFNPSGIQHFFVRDPYNNIFEVFENEVVFKNEGKPTGGVAGVILGVSDMDKSIEFYSGILGYDHVLADSTSIFDDLKGIPGGEEKYRRVLLTHSAPREGSFSNFFGKTFIELLQPLERTPVKIFRDRLWGDLGFIHLCFDIKHMDSLEQECASKGFPFTVNSNVRHNEQGSFDMGEAAGHFSYIEDPDGTLIEFVETHRLPILKRFGIALNLDKRDPKRPLPTWVLKLLSLKRVKGF